MNVLKQTIMESVAAAQLEKEKQCYGNWAP